MHTPSPLSRRPLAIALSLSIALFASSCGSDGGGPRWIRLADGWSPSQLEGNLELLEDLSIRPASEENGLWIDRALEASDFHRNRQESRNVWDAPMPPFAGSRHVFGLRVVVTTDGNPTDPLNREHIPGRIEAPLYLLANNHLSLWLPRDASPPQTTTLSIFLGRGSAHGGVWRAPVEGTVGDGLAVWPGERTTLHTPIPPGSALRFELDGTRWDETIQSVTFRIRLDGEPLFETIFRLDGEVHRSRHTLPLPAEGRDDARLEFIVEGRGATTAFLAPVIGPARIGSPGDRPFEAKRPDVLLFLGDTFRADNLSAYGGAPDLAPNLNALAERSLRFLAARSPATSTLPAHASLFTGLFPLQHGAFNKRALPPSLPRLAELFQRAGYRTAAVTDSGFVSRQFGMDLGFELFDERSYGERKFERLLDTVRSVRAADDGRPLFLFVQTYRVHTPYRTGPEEDQSRYRAIFERTKTYIREHPPARHDPAAAQAVVQAAQSEFGAEYLEVYHDGVHAMDDAFGRFADELEAERYFDRGFFLFTGDHGEEFFEHGSRGHGGPAFEERIRVPLLLRGPGIEPAAVRWSCSLTDIAPTLATLAGFPPLPDWIGHSLLDLDHERPHLFFNENRDGKYLAALDAGHKLFFEDGDLATGTIHAAFDLANDPGEQHNLLEGSLPWPEDLRHSLLPLWNLESTPKDTALRGTIDPGLQDNLRELGYAE